MSLFVLLGQLRDIRKMIDRFFAECTEIQYKYVDCKKFCEIAGDKLTLCEHIFHEFDSGRRGILNSVSSICSKYFVF